MDTLEDGVHPKFYLIILTFNVVVFQLFRAFIPKNISVIRYLVLSVNYPVFHSSLFLFFFQF